MTPTSTPDTYHIGQGQLINGYPAMVVKIDEQDSGETIVHYNVFTEHGLTLHTETIPAPSTSAPADEDPTLPFPVEPPLDPVPPPAD